MQCPKCGNDNPVQVLFCMKCGHELSHEVHEVRAAVRKEVITEENENLERRLRELLLLCIFVLVAALAARSYGTSRQKELSHSVFTSAPGIQVKSPGQIELPSVEVPIPEAKRPPQPKGAPESSAIRLLKKKIGKD